MKPTVLSIEDLQRRILAKACKMSCENIERARQGKADKQVDRDVFEMMVIRKFLPYWSTAQIKQKECYLFEKFRI